MINLNLIAERRAKKTREMTVLRATALGVALLFVAMLVVNGGMFFVHRNVKNLNIAKQKELQGLQPREAAYQTLLAEVQELRPVVNLLARVRTTEAAWMTILADIGRVIPPKVSIAGVNASVGSGSVTLSMNGTAADEKTVGDFMIALREGTRWADNSTLGSVNAVDNKENPKARKVTFSLTVPVRGMFGGDL
ncbi:MAG: PilN domain-containing protein [Armatimonadota bacterium]